MKNVRGKKLFFFFQFLFITVFSGTALQPVNPMHYKCTKGTPHLLNITDHHAHTALVRKDSLHNVDFGCHGADAGLKPWIAPALLISGGTALHFMTGAKESVRDFVQENLAYDGKIDDYTQYAPLIATYALNVFRVKGKNNFGNRTALAVKSFLLNDLIVWQLKHHIDETRPSGGGHSFPSGHTSRAFAFAHFMHKEYGQASPWFSFAAYSCAASVGYMRVAKNAHWISDVVAGAGIGILSTELVYLTHQYKWDNEHLKRLDILPFRLGNQKGIALVYHF